MPRHRRQRNVAIADRVACTNSLDSLDCLLLFGRIDSNVNEPDNRHESPHGAFRITLDIPLCSLVRFRTQGLLRRLVCWLLAEFDLGTHHLTKLMWIISNEAFVTPGHAFVTGS
jgi:hypothetical protein